MVSLFLMLGVVVRRDLVGNTDDQRTNLIIGFSGWEES